MKSIQTREAFTEDKRVYIKKNTLFMHRYFPKITIIVGIITIFMLLEHQRIIVIAWVGFVGLNAFRTNKFFSKGLRFFIPESAREELKIQQQGYQKIEGSEGAIELLSEIDKSTIILSYILIAISISTIAASFVKQ